MSEGRKSWFGRLKEGLTKTRASLVGKVKEVLVRGGQIDEALFEEGEVRTDVAA